MYSTLLRNYISLLLFNIEGACLLVSGDVRKALFYDCRGSLLASRSCLILPRYSTSYTRIISLNGNSGLLLLAWAIHTDKLCYFTIIGPFTIFLKTTFLKIWLKITETSHASGNFKNSRR